MTEAIIQIAEQIIQIPDDIGSQVRYLEILSNLKWSVSELLPEAKAKYNEALARVSEDEINKYIEKKIPTSILNGLIKGKLADEQKIVDALDRINSTLNYQQRSLITIISFKKGV